MARRSDPLPSVPWEWAGAPTWRERDSFDPAPDIVGSQKCTRPRRSARPCHRCEALSSVCRRFARDVPSMHPMCRLCPTALLRRNRVATSRVETSRRFAHSRRPGDPVPRRRLRISRRNHRGGGRLEAVVRSSQDPAWAVPPEPLRSRQVGVSCATVASPGMSPTRSEPGRRSGGIMLPNRMGAERPPGRLLSRVRCSGPQQCSSNAAARSVAMSSAERPSIWKRSSMNTTSPSLRRPADGDEGG